MKKALIRNRSRNITETYRANPLMRKAKYLGLSSVLAFAVAGCGGAPDDGMGSSADVNSSTNTVASSNSSAATQSSSAAPVAPQLQYAFNVAGDRYVGADGTVYAAEPAMYLITAGQTNGLADGSNAIDATEDDRLYQTQRYGMFTFDLPVPAGTYSVVAMFAESWADGQQNVRVLNIDIENASVASGVNLYEVVGREKAYDMTFDGIAVNDGSLTIEFGATTNFATLSGLRVYKTAGGNNPVSSSSAAPVSSSSVAVSSSSSPAGPTFGSVSNGKDLWGAKCLGCHGAIDEATGKAAGSDFVPLIIDVQSYYGSAQTALADYIYNQMPKNNPKTNCDQGCGDDISAYFFDVASTLDNGGGNPDIEFDGQQAYKDFGCLACHGNDGLQESQPIVFENYSLESLTKKINDSMPISEVNPNAWQQCVGNCATAVAEYLWSIRPKVSCDEGESTLPRRVRGLTKFEYVNTINDLFGRNDAETLARTIGSDTEVKGFDNNAYASSITSTRLEGYWAAAQAIAEVANVTPWLSTNNCNQQNVGACFVNKFGRMAFRRPLINDEMDDYSAIFEAGANDEEGARNVVQAMLISPNFLYRSEIGSDGRLTQYEIAGLLAYTFWGSTPDSALLDKAASNTLGNEAQIRQAVDGLVSDARSEKQFVHFGRQWLHIDPVAGIDRDAQLFPTFNGQVAEAMDQELEMFLKEMLLADGYTMSDFLNWDQVFADNTLATFYGLNGAGSEMTKIAAGDQRGGVLRLGAVLARNSKFDESHPIKRGLLVRNNLLCQEFGVPPANVGEVEPFDATKPTRERFAAHSANETCAACHQFIDEVGFAFENYDAVGGFRTAEANGAAVDASGSISGLNRMTDPDNHVFSNLQDLSDILSDGAMQSASSCVAEQFQRMMDGEAKPDSCTVANTVARWNPAEKSLKDLWVEIVASQNFMQRN